MKAVGFCGSARKNGNTLILLETVLKPLKEAGIATSVVEFAGERIAGCTACFECFKRRNGTCILEDDIVNESLLRMVEADVILLGSPVYFTDVSSEMKAFIDRCGMVSRANDDLLKRKVGGAVVAARRAGAVRTFDTLNHFFLIAQMIVVGADYWNIGIGRNRGEVVGDDEAKRTMINLGENIGWILHKIQSDSP